MAKAYEQIIAMQEAERKLRSVGLDDVAENIAEDRKQRIRERYRQRDDRLPREVAQDRVMIGDMLREFKESELI